MKIQVSKLAILPAALLAGCVFSFSNVSAQTETPSPTPGAKELPGPPPPDTLFVLAAGAFRARPEAQAPIDLQNVDHTLLAAAVFHETNRRRREHDLPALKYDGQVWQAAAIQALAMAEGQFMGHAQPDSEKKATPWDRVQYVGLDPKFAAENVATSFGLDYESGKPFYTREEGGREIYSYEPGGRAITPHSYLSFAETLLESWMNSPGHRANILATEPEFLGCSQRQGKDARGMPVFYCAQVFFTPLPAGPGLGESR